MELWLNRGVFLNVFLSLAVILFLSSGVFGLQCSSPVKIVNNSDSQDSPDISGNIVVWSDDRNGNSDIYKCDLADNQGGCANGGEEQVTSHSSSQESPAVDNSTYIVWQDDRNGNTDIYGDSGRGFQLIVGGSNPQTNPDISGNIVVWRDNNRFLHYTDILEGVIYNISSSPFNPQAKVFGGKIVWVNNNNGDEDIWMCDISLNGRDGGCLFDDEKTEITNDASDQNSPSIDSNFVVWQDHRFGNPTIFRYNLNTGETSQVADDDDIEKIEPFVSGSIIVWTDGLREQIYLCDLNAFPQGCEGGTEQQITSSNSIKFNPRVSGGNIVWSEFDLDTFVLDVGLVECEVSGSVCGNGVVENVEECDGEDFGEYGNGTDQCYVYNRQFSDGDLLCNGCVIGTGSCVAGTCGDGYVNFGEGCDDGGRTRSDGCDASCQVEEGWWCQGVPSSCSLNGWTSPIGVPVPEFGIEQIAPERPSPWNREVENYYYVDYRIGDDQRTYGRQGAPRKTIPSNLKPGAVVEVHGTYDYVDQGRIFVQGDGTAAQPIFIRGQTSNLKPTFTGGELRVEGSYMIFENLIIEEGFSITPTASSGGGGAEPFHHNVIRNSVISSTNGSGIKVGRTFGIEGDTTQYNVIYNNTISDIGDWESDVEKEWDGVLVHQNSNSTWVVDNEIYNNQGSGVHLSWKSNEQQAVPPSYIYVSRNRIYENQENAVDVEVSNDVVISDNNLYDHRIACSSCIFDENGYSVVVRVDGFTSEYPQANNVWILRNRIYDSDGGVRVKTSENVSVIGNLIYDIVYSQGLNSDAAESGGAAVQAIAAFNTTVIGNTIVNTDLGVLRDDFGHRSVGRALNIVNNIISNLTNNYFQQFGNEAPHILIENEDHANVSDINNNLIYQGGDNIFIRWGSDNYTSIDSFRSGENKGEGSFSLDPDFVSEVGKDYRLTHDSPAVDNGTASGVYKSFYDRYGVEIEIDFGGVLRPLDGNQNGSSEWDIGAYEYNGTGGNEPICGNNVAEQGEQCDGIDLRGRTCRVEGHPNGGDLECFGEGHPRECTYDFASCSKLPKRDEFDGNTTDFENEGNISEVRDAVLEKTQKGMINFRGHTLDFEKIDLDTFFSIEDKRIEIDTDSLPRFRVSAELRMYNISYENYEIRKDGAACSGCNVIAYNNGVLVFNVSSFSVYEVVDTGSGENNTEEGDNNDGNNNGGGNNNNGGGTQTTNGPVPGCEVNWDCGGWSECSDGAQARSCVDLSDCGTTYQKPSEVQECGEESSSDDVTRSSFGEWLRNVFGRLRQLPVALYVSVVGLISAIILFILLSRIFKRRRIANRYVLNKIKESHS